MEPRYIPIPRFPDYHPWPSVQALRFLVRKSTTNGFEKAIKRIGRRVLIDEQGFHAWVKERSENYEK